MTITSTISQSLWRTGNPGPPLAGACHVWWASPAQAEPRHLALLSDSERGRHDSLQRVADRNRFAVANALLRLAVGGYTGVPTERVRITRSCPDCDRPHGKPMVPDSTLRVSVSHSGDRIAVALTHAGSIGVDVEEINDQAPVRDLTAHVLSPAESPRFPTEQVEAVRGFFTAWTRKESVLKATGDGLRIPMPMLTLSDHDQPAELLAFTGRPDLVGTTTMRDLRPGDGYLAALTLLTPGPVEVLEFDATGVLGH